MKQKFGKFIIDEIVFCVASLLAVLSMLVVPPSAAYVEYIDFRVLALLFCLMIVVAGFTNAGVFEKLMNVLVGIVHNTRQLAIVLVMACFFLSMFITNDVALITLVPFAIMVLRTLYGHIWDSKKMLSVTGYVVVLQTVAANLGSMFTPIGNPQNLYLYTTSAMSIGEFLMLMLPYTAVSLVLLIVACFFVKGEPIKGATSVTVIRKGREETAFFRRNSVRIAVYTVLFLVSILTVLNVVHYLVMLGAVIVAVLIVEPKLLKGADYILLLTFVAFFVFVGNIKNVEIVNNLIGNLCDSGSVFWVAIAASQVISNVPAAVLLSGFNSDYSAMIVGTNIGGLGTIIASMASLISYKFYAKIEGAKKGSYMLLFTAVNIIFLAVLVILALFVR